MIKTPFWAKVLMRLLACPFVFVIGCIPSVFANIIRTIYFIKYGGEWYSYAKDDKPLISDIYNKLKNNEVLTHLNK